MTHFPERMYFNTDDTEDRFNVSVETHVYISMWRNVHWRLLTNKIIKLSDYTRMAFRASNEFNEIINFVVNVIFMH